MVKSCIEIAENSIKDGNSDLESLPTKGALSRDAIAKTHQKISMSVKRKSELEVCFKRHKKRDKS